MTSYSELAICLCAGSHGAPRHLRSHERRDVSITGRSAEPNRGGKQCAGAPDRLGKVYRIETLGRDITRVSKGLIYVIETGS